MFCLEVIAHGLKAAPALPAPGVLRTDPRGILPQAQAAKSASPVLGGISQLVQSAHLDGRPAPGAAAAGAVLPRMRRAVSARGSQASHPGRRGGPHRAAPGRLGQVCRPGQPPEPVQTLPRPQDGQRNGRRTAKKQTLISAAMRAKWRDAWARAPGRRAPAGIPCGHAPRRESLRQMVQDRRPSSGEDFFPTGKLVGWENVDRRKMKYRLGEVEGCRDQGSRWLCCRPTVESI